MLADHPGIFRTYRSLHLVDGVKMLSGRSFPSGHATSAFALFLCLALISTNRYLKLICFFLACFGCLFKGLSFAAFSD